MSELTIKKERHIKEILNNFNFEKVHNTMKKLDWEWFNVGIPTIKDLKKQSKILLEDVCKYDICSSSSGGLKAIKNNDHLELEFVIADYDSSILNTTPEYEKLLKNKIRKIKIDKLINK